MFCQRGLFVSLLNKVNTAYSYLMLPRFTAYVVNCSDGIRSARTTGKEGRACRTCVLRSDSMFPLAKQCISQVLSSPAKPIDLFPNYLPKLSLSLSFFLAVFHTSTAQPNTRGYLHSETRYLVNRQLHITMGFAAGRGRRHC